MIHVCSELKYLLMGKGECFSVMKDITSFQYVWKIENFSKLNACFKDSDVHVQCYKTEMVPSFCDLITFSSFFVSYNQLITSLQRRIFLYYKGKLSLHHFSFVLCLSNHHKILTYFLYHTSF